MFQGFSQSSIDFLWGISFNNDRGWFQEHKQEFLDHVDGPMKELAHEVAERMEEKFPKQKKYLGIYILDYPSGEPIPNEYMELQCEFGLSLLKQKRIDGMIFLTNCVMGVGLPSEYWLREWIDKVKNIELPD